MTLGELARRLECPVEGDSGIEIHRVAKIETAGPGDLTFLANPKYAAALASTKASAVIAGADVEGAPCAVIRSASPYLTFARAAQALSPERPPEPGVHPLAWVSAEAVVDPTASIGPFAAIGAGVRIGARTIVHPHVAIGADSVIGADCLIHANVSIRERCTLGARVIVQNGAVIGSDGYGFAQRPDGSHEKIPQTAPVVIEDDVEIGANTTIDRPAVGETRIKAGTKIDNLVQIAHGVVLGRHVLLAAQVGIAGSTVIGDHVTFGGQVGVGGHLTIGDRVKAVGQSGITNSVAADGFVSGYPAIPNHEWRRSSAVFRKLPEMRRQLRDLTARLQKIEETDK
ncbi:MAG: UDP-3-O-(3-hydroxymyristoyl)glucosamine N-acyltransferase [Acidobacteria bacterium]|nr:UDP-3-O-(3-hydroxymyristoyl)glucosamine N-acyltransferase [Acidobacteriota bacterium]MSO63024.1 UDP-3-O-(3-hydroxymyristoyl)glucosamine N-acyltransferase [Acidobacteriota bacterium]